MLPRTGPLAILAIAAASLTGCDAGAFADAESRIVLGTGGIGGVYQPLGEALAGRLAEQDPQREYSAEPTSGSLENIERVLAGEFALGFAIGTTVVEAFSGGHGFEEPQDRLRIVAPLHPNYTHVLVSVASGIERVDDLRGRVVSVGSEGSGTEQVARQLLEEHGIAFSDVVPRRIGFSESVDGLLAGELDAAILSVGVPAPVVVTALESGRARLIAIDAARVRTMADRYAYYSEGTIRAGAYPAQPVAAATLVVLNWIVARDNLSVDVARRILDLLNTQRRFLRETAALDDEVNLRNLFAAPIPLHSAVRAWLGEAPPVFDDDVAEAPGVRPLPAGGRPPSSASPAR
jgi:uncharacterized protein